MASKTRLRSDLLVLSAVMLLALSPTHAPVVVRDHAIVTAATTGPNDFEFDYGAAQAAAREDALEQQLREARAEAWDAADTRVAELDESTRTAAVVVDLESGETLLSHRASGGFVPASVYKLPVVYSILSAVERGKLSEDSTIAGMNVQQCIESAIVRSENECTEAWLAEHGPRSVEREAARVGMTHTTFRDYGIRTNASDVAAFLSALYDGTLLNESNTERLIELMKRQEWRDGMPSVLEPMHTVADKVGFLPNVRTDAGIVYTERGDYVVVILTEADDWPFVAEVAEPIAEALSIGIEPKE